MPFMSYTTFSTKLHCFVKGKEKRCVFKHHFYFQFFSLFFKILTASTYRALFSQQTMQQQKNRSEKNDKARTST